VEGEVTISYPKNLWSETYWRCLEQCLS